MLGRDYVKHYSKVSGVFALVNLSFSFLLITIIHNYQPFYIHYIIFIMTIYDF
jgi:hypothetical protein